MRTGGRLQSALVSTDITRVSDRSEVICRMHINIASSVPSSAQAADNKKTRLAAGHWTDSYRRVAR
jgi:hypothetical protein